jgi:hypothetical protein
MLLGFLTLLTEEIITGSILRKLVYRMSKHFKSAHFNLEYVVLGLPVKISSYHLSNKTWC